MTLHFLVVEGNTAPARAAYKAGLGQAPSESYAATVAAIAGDARCDIAFPADEGANLPDAAGIGDYDGVFVTGSALNIWQMESASLRQIDLMRTVYRSGVPSFGSCWGLQLGTVAAGGDVGPNAKGREMGFARDICVTDAGRSHPLLAGRPGAFTAPAIHLDVVVTPPADTVILASNALTPVQAAEIRSGGGTFWGVQYHPEFSLEELGSIIARQAGRLAEEGFGRCPQDLSSYADDLLALHADPGRADLAWRLGIDGQVLEPALRTLEIANFIARLVRPHASRRGRA